jgi:hypothetical protein
MMGEEKEAPNEGQTGDQGDEHDQAEREVEMRRIRVDGPIGGLKIEEVAIPELAVDWPELVRCRVRSERENEVSNGQHRRRGGQTRPTGTKRVTDGNGGRTRDAGTVEPGSGLVWRDGGRLPKQPHRLFPERSEKWET